MAEREQLIRDISIKHQLRGYDHSPLEKDKVLQFGSRLADLQQRQNAETESLQVSFTMLFKFYYSSVRQGEIRVKTEEYNTDSRRLHSELEAFKQQKANIRDRIVWFWSTSCVTRSNLYTLFSQHYSQISHQPKHKWMKQHHSRPRSLRCKAILKRNSAGSKRQGEISRRQTMTKKSQRRRLKLVQWRNSGMI